MDKKENAKAPTLTLKDKPIAPKGFQIVKSIKINLITGFILHSF
jgi:hypothetical protein